MIQLQNKFSCCGCTACASICPVSCITMQQDKEGFFYPVIDSEVCINCNKCESVCPIINERKELAFSQDGYVVQIKNNIVRQKSAAGGFFHALSEYVITQRGYVCGVELDENFQCKHIITSSLEEVKKISGSKYVQSQVGVDTFNKIKELLDGGKLVVFSGTPCQVEGLLNAIGKRDNLITVDFVCHSVPSQMIFNKYIEFLEKHLGGKIDKISFRDKYYGYGFPTMRVESKENSRIYHGGMEMDPYLRMFFSGIADRPSCYFCKFKKRYRRSDYTIWDCGQVGTYSKKMDDDLGATKLLIHSVNGKAIFQEIKEKFICIKIEPDELVKEGSLSMYNTVTLNSKREIFWKDAIQLKGDILFNKYFPLDFKHQIKNRVRVLMVKVGIQRSVRKIYHKLRNYRKLIKDEKSR